MNDDGKYEVLKAAVAELDAAQQEKDDHVVTWGQWYERERPVRRSEQIAENKIHERERVIATRLNAAIRSVLDAAREYTK